MEYRLTIRYDGGADMAKSELKSFDITTYDVEIEFNKKIAPIQKKIDTLDKRHETKSLKAHKDFLTKEKKAKKDIQVLEDKLVIKEQRIEKASDNKLVKLRKRDHVLKEEFDLFKQTTSESVQLEIDQIDTETEILKDKEQHDIKRIKERYQQNVASYIERLDTYNNNFTANKDKFQEEYILYSKKLDDNLASIQKVKENDEAILNQLLNDFLQEVESRKQEQQNDLKKLDREQNTNLVNVRKESNINKNNVKALIQDLRATFEMKYKNHISKLKDESKKLSTSFELRKLLINKDLEINNQKLQNQIETLEQNTNKKTIKSINMKKDLFNIRANTVISYEEKLLSEKQSIIQEEIKYFENVLKQEITNLEKLTVQLNNDQEEMKRIQATFNNNNIEIIETLNNSETLNSEYLIKHDKLKQEFLQNYINQFHELQKRLIMANKQQIDQLETINGELDDIDKFLDTVEPLKEIELNHLRESIEVTEIEQRYNIKYAKQEFEVKSLQNKQRKDISHQELKTKDLKNENNRNITTIKAKETMDKLIAKAKLKFDKAEEIYKLRKNSTKLERNILKSSYETELDKYEHKKELAKYNAEREIILNEREIENQIINLKTESDYKAEVINKQLEEDLLNHQEKINRIEHERDSFTSAVEKLIQEEEYKTDKEIIKLNKEMDDKLLLVDEALAREIKDPSLNIAKSEVIITERIAKFDANDEFFISFIESSKELMHSDNLNPDQLKQLITKNKTIYDNSYKYIENTYEVLIEAVKFMNGLEEQAMQNKINSIKDQQKAKRLQKQLTKKQTDTRKQVGMIEHSQNEHKNNIHSNIKATIQSIGKEDTITEDNVLEQVNNLYTTTFASLKNLQANIRIEVISLYSPLTKHEKDIIKNAKEQQVKAKQLIEKEREEKITPSNIKLRDFIKEKESEKHKQIENYNKEISQVKEIINKLKKEALSEVKDVTKKQTKQLDSHNEMLDKIKNKKDELIEERISYISENKLKLEDEYYAHLKTLDEKDEESLKIYEYEQRIYNIALENAETRYNDIITKADISIDRKTQENKESGYLVESIYTRNQERITKELKDATSEFEKNIFTTRPKYEESITEARKAIEDEQKIKLKRRKELIDLNRKMTKSINNQLTTSYRTTYDLLRENLNFYIDKFKIIQEEYFNNNISQNKDLIQKLTTFRNELFTNITTKFDKNSKNLQEINQKLS